MPHLGSVCRSGEGEGIWARAKASLAQAVFLGLFDELGVLHPCTTGEETGPV